MRFGHLRENNKISAAEINMVPLIDVMLVLLVIFIVTAPLVTQSVSLQLPQTVALENVSQTEPIKISISADGAVYVNDVPRQEEELIMNLTALKESTTEIVPVHLYVDATVSYEKVAQLLAMLSKVGLTNIGFVSIPKK